MQALGFGHMLHYRSADLPKERRALGSVVHNDAADLDCMLSLDSLSLTALHDSHSATLV